MGQNSLNKKIAIVGLAGVLGGCSATETHRVFSVLGPMVGVIGAAPTGSGKENVKKEGYENFFESGPIYRRALVDRVNNVPEILRNPVDPLFGARNPITDDNVKVGDRTGGLFRYGGRLNLVENLLSFRTGLELEIGGMGQAGVPTNQETPLGPFDANYYSIYTKAGPDWNSFLIPKLFAGIEFKFSNSLSLGAGYSIWREDLVAEIGRYAGNSRSTGNGYTQSQSRDGGFNLVDMTVGSVFGSIKYRTDEGFNLFIELGIQDILDKHYHDLGREADIEFGKNPFAITIGGSLTF